MTFNNILQFLPLTDFVMICLYTEAKTVFSIIAQKTVHLEKLIKHTDYSKQKKIKIPNHKTPN